MNPLTWIKANLQLAGAIAGSVILVLLVVGFIQDPFGFRHRHEEKLKDQRDTAVAEAQALNAALISQDHHTAVTGQTAQSVEKEADGLRKLPGAETPIDPARRAALCASLQRMRNTPACRNPR